MLSQDFLSLKGYQILQKIGQGSFAMVYKAIRKEDQLTVAIKSIHMGKMKVKQISNALNEVRILCSIQHPNIVRYYDAFLDEFNKDLYIIMEFLGGGDLENKLKNLKQNETNFKEDKIWKYSLQILQGLLTLHNLKIIHRDIKPGNLFLNENEKIIKIGDLNTGRILQEEEQMAKTVIGTPYYLAPEIWQNKEYDFRCDVFSFGCVLYEMITLRPPFKGKSVNELYANICSGEYAPLPVTFSNALHYVIKKCLAKDMEKRINVEQLIQTMQVKRKLEENRELDCRLIAKDSWVSTSVLKTERPRSVHEIKTTLKKFRNVSSESQFKIDLENNLRKGFESSSLKYPENSLASSKLLEESGYKTSDIYLDSCVKRKNSDHSDSKKKKIPKRPINYDQKVKMRKEQMLTKVNRDSNAKSNPPVPKFRRNVSYKRLHQRKVSHREKSYKELQKEKLKNIKKSPRTTITSRKTSLDKKSKIKTSKNSSKKNKKDSKKEFNLKNWKKNYDQKNKMKEDLINDNGCPKMIFDFKFDSLKKKKVINKK
jgi:NIMA (never in mitosis gene a)-related kinase